MTDPKPTRRWLCPTPGWLVLALLVVECLLWLSERFQWLPFNHHKGWTVLIAVAVVGVVFLAMLLWFIVALVFRWRFQFSLRSLLVLVVVVAIPCSWMAVEMKAAKRQKEAVEAILKMKGDTRYDWEVDVDDFYNPLPNAEPPEPAWLRSVLGNDCCWSVKYVWLGVYSESQKDVVLGSDESQSCIITDEGLENLRVLNQLESLSFSYNQLITDAGLANLEGMIQLRELSLNSTPITDAGLVHLAGLPRLQTLELCGTPITDAGLAHLAGLPQLQTLDLRDTQITDSGLAYLAGLTRLRVLWLDSTQITEAGLAQFARLTRLQCLSLTNTKITDEGLAHLAGLTQLQQLELDHTKVTDDGVKKLQRALPKCKITH